MYPAVFTGERMGNLSGRIFVLISLIPGIVSSALFLTVRWAAMYSQLFLSPIIFFPVFIQKKKELRSVVLKAEKKGPVDLPGYGR